jgi:hypothetical protein
MSFILKKYPHDIKTISFNRKIKSFYLKVQSFSSKSNALIVKNTRYMQKMLRLFYKSYRLLQRAGTLFESICKLSKSHSNLICQFTVMLRFVLCRLKLTVWTVRKCGPFPVKLNEPR